MMVKHAWVRTLWQSLATRFQKECYQRKSPRRAVFQSLTEALECRVLLTAPVVNSIDLKGDQVTNAHTVNWTVTFNEPVTGVDPTDFSLVEKGTVGGNVSQVTPVTDSIFTVTASGYTGSGSVGLRLINDGSIHDFAGNPLAIVNFQSQSIIATGTNPVSVKLADLNGDGILDVVVANKGSNSVSEFLGNGDGTFHTPQSFATGMGPQSVTVGDLNGDGKPDLIVANFYDNSVSVLLGNGDGTFQSQQTFPAGMSPISVTMGDVNGDGRPDLAVANVNSDSASVLLGNGDGTFQLQQTFGTGSSPWSVALGDLNGDGKPDLTVVNRNSNNVSVLLGNGDGTFQPQQTFDTGYLPSSVSLGDMNRDGKPDLAIANNTGNGSVSILLGNGDGTFQYQQLVATGPNPTSVILADLNGDGIPDLAVTSADYSIASSQLVGVLLGNGDGTFQDQKTFATGGSPYSVTAGDVNGDGQPDLVIANLQDNTVSVLIGNGKQGFTGSVYTITPDDPPTLVGSSTLIFKENQLAVALNTTVVVTDVDNTTLASATVRISANYSAGEDVLGFVANTTTGNIAGSFDTLTGTLTLTSAGATATLVQFQSALRLVTYGNTTLNPSTAVRSVDYQTFDGLLSGNTVTSLISVVATNNAPTVAGVTTLVYAEKQRAISINPSLTASDVDNATLVSATVKFSANYLVTQDILGFIGNVTTGNITGSFNPSSGTLTLTSAGALATVAQFQSALRMVTYLNTSSTPSTLTRSVAYQISDGALLSNTVLSTITVASVKDAPTLVGTSALIFKENQAAVVLNSTIVVGDVDSPTLACATVRISANYAAGQDLLGFVANAATTGNITGSFVSGTLTLTSAGATATLAQFQAALRLVTYSNTSSNPSTGVRSVDYQASDGTVAGNRLTSLVTIVPTNAAPLIAGVNAVAYTEKQIAIDINPSVTVSDVDNLSLTWATVKVSTNYVSTQDVLGFVGNPTTGNIIGSFNPATGILTLIPAGPSATVAQFQSALQLVAYSNTSANPSTLARSVTYQVSDGSLLSNTVISTITVAAVNNAPTLVGISTLIVANNQIATAINGAVVVGDVDNVTLASATVQISANYLATEDVLGFVANAATTGDIVGTFDSVAGTMTLTSAGATLVQFQAALRLVTYLNTNGTNPLTAARSVDYQISDGQLGSNAVTSLITIKVGGLAPVIVGTGTLVYSEKKAATAINPSLIVSDADSLNLAWATVRISGNYSPTQDVLGFIGDLTTGNITGSFNSSTGTLTLISAGASATVAQFQAALQFVSYFNTSSNPSTMTRPVTYQISDASNVSNVVTANVSFF